MGTFLLEATYVVRHELQWFSAHDCGSSTFPLRGGVGVGFWVVEEVVVWLLPLVFLAPVLCCGDASIGLVHFECWSSLPDPGGMATTSAGAERGSGAWEEKVSGLKSFGSTVRAMFERVARISLAFSSYRSVANEFLLVLMQVLMRDRYASKFLIRRAVGE